jgi:hypothetical protein
MTLKKTVILDGATYDLADLTTKALEALNSVQFVDAQIQQKQNEWAVADTARLAYANAIKREVRR